jgi:hypothetical protein
MPLKPRRQPEIKTTMKIFIYSNGGQEIIGMLNIGAGNDLFIHG